MSRQWAYGALYTMSPITVVCMPAGLNAAHDVSAMGSEHFSFWISRGVERITCDYHTAPRRAASNTHSNTQWHDVALCCATLRRKGPCNRSTATWHDAFSVPLAAAHRTRS